MGCRDIQNGIGWIGVGKMGNSMATRLLARLPADTILAEMSTVSPQLSERVARDLERQGVAYQRCLMPGSTTLARADTLIALASGDAAAWETVSPLIDRLAWRKFYLGPREEVR